MPFISSDFINNRLIPAVDIVRLINNYVPLKKESGNYTCCCPFHKEKTPSFKVNPAKQFFKCFGCNESGNVIDFVMKYKNVSYPEAIEEIAHFAGMKVEYEKSSQRQQQQIENNKGYYELMERLATYFTKCLHNEPKALDYFQKSRGLSNKTIADSRLGYAPNNADYIIKEVAQSESDIKKFVELGLLKQKTLDNGKVAYFAFFRDRVIFPIFDIKGRVISFGGRVLEGGEPKYLNTSESPIFHKRTELFGLYECLKATRNRPDKVLLVEGYMDVIALRDKGINYAVASLGTAATLEHFKLLYRFTSKVYCCFDSDDAGTQASWKAMVVATPEIKNDKEIRFVRMPPGYDPDVYVRECGLQDFELLLDNAISYPEFLLYNIFYKDKVQISDPNQKVRFINRVLSCCKAINNPILVSVVFELLGQFVNISHQELKNIMNSEQITPAPEFGRLVEPDNQERNYRNQNNNYQRNYSSNRNGYDQRANNGYQNNRYNQGNGYNRADQYAQNDFNGNYDNGNVDQDNGQKRALATDQISWSSDYQDFREFDNRLRSSYYNNIGRNYRNYNQNGDRQGYNGGYNNRYGRYSKDNYNRDGYGANQYNANDRGSYRSNYQNNGYRSYQNQYSEYDQRDNFEQKRGFNQEQSYQPQNQENFALNNQNNYEQGYNQAQMSQMNAQAQMSQMPVQNQMRQEQNTNAQFANEQGYNQAQMSQMNAQAQMRQMPVQNQMMQEQNTNAQFVNEQAYNQAQMSQMNAQAQMNQMPVQNQMMQEQNNNAQFTNEQAYNQAQMNAQVQMNQVPVQNQMMQEQNTNAQFANEQGYNQVQMNQMPVQEQIVQEQANEQMQNNSMATLNANTMDNPNLSAEQNINATQSSEDLGANAQEQNSDNGSSHSETKLNLDELKSKMAEFKNLDLAQFADIPFIKTPIPPSFKMLPEQDDLLTQYLCKAAENYLNANIMNLYTKGFKSGVVDLQLVQAVALQESLEKRAKTPAGALMEEFAQNQSNENESDEPVLGYGGEVYPDTNNINAQIVQGGTAVDPIQLDPELAKEIKENFIKTQIANKAREFIKQHESAFFTQICKEELERYYTLVVTGDNFTSEDLNPAIYECIAFILQQPEVVSYFFERYNINEFMEIARVLRMQEYPAFLRLFTLIKLNPTITTGAILEVFRNSIYEPLFTCLESIKFLKKNNQGKDQVLTARAQIFLRILLKSIQYSFNRQFGFIINSSLKVHNEQLIRDCFKIETIFNSKL